MSPWRPWRALKALRTKGVSDALTEGGVSQAVGDAVTEIPSRFRYRFGEKPVYLPNAVITFIRPKDKKESPYLARFIVPLTFNKLDIRDYLWHAYGVAVVSVGSMVMGQGLEKKGSILMSARRTFRPAAKKMMICKLEEPFVWPARQVGDELPEPFEWFRYKHNVKVEEQQEQVQGMLKAGEIELFTQKEEVRGRDALRQEAQALLDGKKEWKNEVTLDPRWEGIDAVENDGGRKKL